jgi:hypothetical protein
VKSVDAVPASFGRRILATVVGRVCKTLGGWLLLTALMVLQALPAQAQGVDLPLLRVTRQDSGLNLDFEVKLALSRAVEDAMQRGVPLYFTAQAEVFRPRWYWRDERVSRASRTWRLSYQPLTASWRVSFGGLSQNFATADAALAMVSRAGGWRITEGETVDPTGRYYIEFSYRLDSAMLPRPMQLDLAAQSDWRLAVERTIKLD